MVSLEQIRALEARVEKAVVLIDKLRRENAELEQSLIEASRSREQATTAYVELERKAEASIRMAGESAAAIESLSRKLSDAESRLQSAELRAATAEEQAAVLERKTLAAESESSKYRERALAAESRSAELETKADEFKREQSRIEEGLSHALQKLDAFEDMVMGIQVAPAIASSGDEKVEVIEQSPSTSAAQVETFPGAEHELDIF